MRRAVHRSPWRKLECRAWNKSVVYLPDGPVSAGRMGRTSAASLAHVELRKYKREARKKPWRRCAGEMNTANARMFSTGVSGVAAK